MAATKYVPKHLVGAIVGDSPEAVFIPGSGSPAPLGQVLTGIVVANGAATPCAISLWYLQGVTPIYLFDQLLVPARSTTNLDLYLPLGPGQNVSAVASEPNYISLTMYGLELVSI